MSRLDVYIYENNLSHSREHAKGLIKDKKVYVNGRECLKPAYQVMEGDVVEVYDDKADYAGRGRIKLEYAFEAFSFDVKDKVCADIGASSGGFTQCLINRGAKFVYAVDVGHGQLNEELAENPKVKNLEGVNARYLTKDYFEEAVDFISADLSFISLRLIIPAALLCLKDKGEMVLLIKPQFEAGRTALNKKGIVKNKKDHIRVLEQLFNFFENLQLSILAAEPSPIKGGDGNIEYLVHLKKDNEDFKKTYISAKDLAEKAFGNPIC